MKYPVAILLLLLFISSCHKKCDNPTLCDEPVIGNGDCITDSNQLKPLLLGKWNWTQTEAGWTGEKTNPCTENRNFSYAFEANGVARYFQNDSLKGTGYYSFSNSSGSQIVVTDSSLSFHSSGWVRLCGNYLVIDQTPVDGSKEIFLRAQ